MASPLRVVAAVLVAAILVLTIRLGAAPLDAREVPYARAAAGIVASGDPVGLAVDGTPRPDIPPLLPWLQASFLRTWGEGATLVRLPSAIATLASLLVAAWVALRRFGPEGALWTSGILLATPLVFAGARLATPDALLALHVLGVVALETGAHEDSGGSRAMVLGALVGLAFLAQGPTGILLPLAVMLGGRTASGQALVPRMRNLGFAVAAFGVVALPWILTLVARAGTAGVGSILRDGVLGRSVAGEGVVRPPWFYAIVVAVGLAPWVGPLATGMLRAVVPGRGAEGPTSRYAAGGFLCGLLILSLAPVKDPLSVLSLAPLAAVTVTAEIGEELGRPRVRRWGRALVACALVALAVTAGTAAFAAGPRLRPFAVVAALVVGAGAAVALGGVILERPRLAYGAGIVSMLATFLAAALLLV